MEHERLLQTSAPLLYHTCLQWDDVPPFNEVPFSQTFALDIQFFFITFSNDGRKSMDETPWVPPLQASLKMPSKAGELLLDYPPQTPTCIQLLLDLKQLTSSPQYKKELTKQAYSFLTFFIHLGEWLLESSNGEDCYEKKCRKFYATVEQIQKDIQKTE